jgi:hypothetical protein
MQRGGSRQGVLAGVSPRRWGGVKVVMAGEGTCSTGDEGGGERRSHRGQGWPECRAHRGSSNGSDGGYQSDGCCGSLTVDGG